MKKITYFLSIGLIAASMLGGCGSSSSSDDTKPSATPTPSQTPAKAGCEVDGNVMRITNTSVQCEDKGYTFTCDENGAISATGKATLEAGNGTIVLEDNTYTCDIGDDPQPSSTPEPSPTASGEECEGYLPC